MKNSMRRTVWALTMAGCMVCGARAADDDSWTSSDKFLHFGASFAIDSFGYWGAREALGWRQPVSLAAAAGATLAIGAGKELTDDRFDEKDMAWNAAGVAVSSALWWLVDRRDHAVQVVITPHGALGLYAWKF